jgi:hypothetical protein
MPLRTMPTLNFTSESQGSPLLTPRQVMELNLLPPSEQRRNKNQSQSYLLSPPSLVRSNRAREPKPDMWMNDAVSLVDSLQAPEMPDEKSIIKLHPGDDGVPRLKLQRRFNNSPGHNSMPRYMYIPQLPQLDITEVKETGAVPATQLQPRVLKPMEPRIDLQFIR